MGNGSLHSRVSFAPGVELQIPPLRSGMTKGRLALLDLRLRYGWEEGRTAFTERNEGRTNGIRLVAFVSFVCSGSGTADPSTTVRDDKGKVGSFGFAFAIWMGRGPDTYPSDLTRKCKWEMAIGIPET
jgi:hypothetical protein